jgi:hypothetical protein
MGDLGWTGLSFGLGLPTRPQVSVSHLFRPRTLALYFIQAIYSGPISTFLNSTCTLEGKI